MLLFAAVLLGSATFAPPVPWLLGFAPEGRLPFAADLDGDGYGDLICVSPKGDSFIDVAINREGAKSKYAQRALSNWGKECQAAAVGLIDDAEGVDIAGLFEGKVVKLAGSWDGNALKSRNWVTLPKALDKPRMAFIDGVLIAWSEKSGDAFRISQSGGVEQGTPPKDRSAYQDSRPGTARASNPASNPHVVFGATGTAFAVPDPEPRSAWAVADMDKDGDEDLIQFRWTGEPHTGNNVLIHRNLSPGETDSDHDGLSNTREAELKTDPLNPDTDNDGLLDGWEVGSYRDLNLKELGCDPRHADIICLISRFTQLKEDFMKEQMGEVVKYYASLESVNPDGTKGWNLHPIYLDPVPEEEQKKPWWELRDKLRPLKWKGLVHWMQLTPWGGGQADQLGDGGGCGGGGWALYATFVHEFGHQLGLPHEGFYGAAWCPTYPSLMNYAYSYGYEDDIKKVRYSDGRLADFKMRETDLSEIIPLPYEKIKFLEKGPYRYRLKPDGDRTLIDWDWNGVFGEEHVKADINYSYSTTAGRRDEVDKLHSAPWLFTHDGSAFALFAKHELKADPKTDPTVSAEKPGALILRRLIEPYKWEPARTLVAEGVTGDPVAISFNGKIILAYQTKDGVEMRMATLRGADSQVGAPITLDSNGDKVPALGVFQNRLLLGLWDPKTQRAEYGLWDGNGFVHRKTFGFLSTTPISFAEDTLKHRLIVGLAWDQSVEKPSRWQIRRYSLSGNTLYERGKDWIEGEKGGARGRSRPTVLFDPDPAWGPDGRVYYFGLGLFGKDTPWSCAYVAHTIGDKTVGGGWRVKRYYDEWTQSRSAPAAAWFGGDIIYAYRWVDGGQTDRDNLLHVAYRGSGIEDAIMGDFDDISLIRDFGMRYSILTVGE